MWGLVFAIVGTIGVGGFIALAIFAPPLASLVAKFVWSILQWLLSTRVGCSLLTAIAVGFAGLLYGDHRDHLADKRVRAEWRAAEQRAIAQGSTARNEAEGEIPQVGSEPAEPPAAEPPKSRIPFLDHFPGVHHEACPPPQPAPACPPAKRRPVDRVLRGDPDNRDNH